MVLPAGFCHKKILRSFYSLRMTAVENVILSAAKDLSCAVRLLAKQKTDDRRREGNRRRSKDLEIEKKDMDFPFSWLRTLLLYHPSLQCAWTLHPNKI